MKQVVVGLVLCALSVPAHAAVTVMDNNGWKFSVGGFVEMDAIHDSTRSLTEIGQNTAIARPDTVNGEAGRTQFSMRNSRLSFNLDAPEVDGWKTRGYYEMDFLGFDLAPGANNSESAYFNNPTFRARHVYLSAESNGWQLLAGQTWNLFGWQPYYFIPTIQVAPIVGMAYNRTGQFRVVKTMSQENGDTVQAALTVDRPPQRDASMPDFEAGLRYAFAGRTAGFTGGSTGADKAQPMSIGVTGAARQFKIPRDVNNPTGDQTSSTGYAFAADALIPVIASSDGKDTSNTLSIGGEFTFGKGYADQMGGWTGGESSPISQGSNALNGEKNTNLDAGYGAFDSNDNFGLVKLRTWNAYLQYHLSSSARAWISAGYSTLFSNNISDFTGTNGKLSAGNGASAYNKDENYFVNIMHDFTNQIRMGFEYAYMQTTYVDTTKASNNRYQLNAFYMF